jgi:LacI family transcriptional regulator
MGVTQKEIAEELKMSQSYVARALRNDSVVPLATRQRVQATAAAMGYEAESNREARIMAARRFGQRIRTGIVAVVFPPEASAPRFVPFYRMILDAMRQEAELDEMDICVCPCRGGALPRLVRDRNVDGVIAINCKHDLVAEIHALSIPTVTFHAKYEEFHSVLSDDYDGACQATRHLLELGHRDIAYMGATPMPDEGLSARLQGFYDTMRENGVVVREEWVVNDLPLPQTTDEVLCEGCRRCGVCCGWDILQARAGNAEKRGPLPFTALVCHNDPIAMSIVTAAKAQGYRVPEDFSVVGFDNVSRSYQFEPELTSVDLGRAELGRSAIRLLAKVIAQGGTEGRTHEAEHFVCPVTLAVHQSTQAPKVLTLTQ